MSGASDEPSRPATGGAADPVVERRARIARWVSLGQRLGYGLFAIACVVFFAGFVAGFQGWVVNLIVVAMVLGSLILAPAIVFGYGIKAADRADREGTWGDPNP